MVLTRDPGYSQNHSLERAIPMNSGTHASSTTLAVPVGPNEHTTGSSHARLFLLEYGDFECPSCKVAAPAVKLLLERHAGHLRVIFRHFPLEEAHPHALLAAEAAEIAGAQGKFWEMHDMLFERQAHLKPKDLVHYAELLGLDMVRYHAEMDDHIHLQKVREDIEGGRRSHIRATPTFFLNGVIQDISFGMKVLHDAVAAAVTRNYKE
jgi:protein-disulfide isomerase